MKRSVNHIQKESILKDIASALERHCEIILAYVFGSFIHCDSFSDIDIGVLTGEDIGHALPLPQNVLF